MYYLVFDIGGTNFRSALYDSATKELSKHKSTPTPSFKTHPGATIEQLQALLVDAFVNEVEARREQTPNLAPNVGITIPAPVANDGSINKISSLWGDGVRDLKLPEILAAKLPGNKFFVINDMTAAAQRYATKFQDRDLRYAQVITVSTGVGSKAIDFGRKPAEIVLGKNGLAGEIGHVRTDFSPDAPFCNCGKQGHLDATSSGPGIVKLAKKWIKEQRTGYDKSALLPNADSLTTYHVAQAIKDGDEFACALLDHTTMLLARSICNTTGLLGETQIIIIGGFAFGVGEPYLASLRKSLAECEPYGIPQEKIGGLIEFGENSDNNGLLGMGFWVENHSQPTGYDPRFLAPPRLQPNTVIEQNTANEPSFQESNGL